MLSSQIIKRRFGGLVALSGLATAVGFLTQVLIAFHFGTSTSLDNYWLVLSLATAASFYVHPLRESLITAVFRANRANSEQASEVLTAGVIVVLCFAAFAAAALYTVAQLTSLNFVTFVDSQFSNLLIAFVPFILFFALSELFNAVLLSLDLAIHQAWARLLSSIGTVACVGWLAPFLGIYALLVSLLLGQTIVLVVSWFNLRARGLRWRFAGLAPLSNRAFISMFCSLLLSYLLSQVYLVVERLTLGGLEAGAVSAFQYATLLVNVMISLVALPLSNLLWPKFLELENTNQRSEMASLAWNAAAPVIFVLLAIASLTWHAASDIISLVYERGSFDEESRQQTVSALRLTVFAAIPIGLVTIALRALMSQKRSVEVAIVGVAMAVTGVLVLSLGWVARSLPIAQAHWVIANGCGALLAWYWVIRESFYSLALARRIFRSVIFSVLAVGLPLLVLPAFEFGKPPFYLSVSLLVQAISYGIMVLFLSILFKLTNLQRLLIALKWQ